MILRLGKVFGAASVKFRKKKSDTIISQRYLIINNKFENQ